MTDISSAISSDARFWNRAARKYATDPIKDMAGYERSLDRVRHYLMDTDQVLEFGCGTGTTALNLADAVDTIRASDISGEMIAIAREKAAAQGCANVSFQIASPETAGWPGQAFDVALGMNVLHLAPRRAAVLLAVRRALKPGGLLITKTPCLKEMTPLIRVAVPVMRWLGKAPYVAFLSADELQRDMQAAGFDIIEIARHGSKGRDIRPFIVARKL